MPLWAVAAISIGVVALVILLLWLALSNGGKPPGEEKGPPPRKPLLVSKAGGDDMVVLTLKLALARAELGDTIIVQEDLDSDVNLILTAKKDLTIQAAEGKIITWKVPTSLNVRPEDRAKFLTLSKVENIRIKGFVLDGGDKLDHLIAMNGNCPGLVLEDLTLKGYRTAGIHVASCWAEPLRPVTLTRLHFQTPPTVPAMIFTLLEPTRPLSSTNRDNKYFEFRDCRFGGARIKIQQQNVDNGEALLSNVRFREGNTLLEALPTSKTELFKQP
jgi:hypothetical protein